MISERIMKMWYTKNSVEKIHLEMDFASALFTFVKIAAIIIVVTERRIHNRKVHP